VLRAREETGPADAEQVRRHGADMLSRLGELQ
jgi:hypothetical protein